MELLDINKVKYIIVHCTDTRCVDDIDCDIVRVWHKARGFEDIGYHYLIHPSGFIEIGRPIEYVGAHCVGYNKMSVGVAYVGGRDSNWNLADTRTYQQKIALAYCFLEILRFYPNIQQIVGHNDCSVKYCPCFNAKLEYKDFLTNLYKPNYHV